MDFDQPCPEERSRNAEHHVLVSDRGAEIRLLKKTARRIVSPGDRKERMNSTVWRTVRIKLESGFAYRTVFPNKRRDLVVRAFFFRHLDLRIDGWTGPSYIRMRVAASATVQVEARPETNFRVGNRASNRLHFFKVFTTILKQLLLELGQI